jgi:formate-dependent nitrite reductase membrane component NrfD
MPGQLVLLLFLFLLASCLLLLALHLLDAWYRHVTGRYSVRRLLRGDVRSEFLLGAIGLGVVIPLVLIGVAGLAPGANVILLAAAGLANLAGNWFSKLAIIRAGAFAPFL